MANGATRTIATHPSYAVIGGAILGAILWMTWRAALGGLRDFESIAGAIAERYELQADEEVADEARRLLDRPSSAGRHRTAPARV